MDSGYRKFAIAGIFAFIVGCNGKNGQQTTHHIEAGVQSASSRETKISALIQVGFAKITVPEAESYREGIVDAKGNEMVEPASNLLVNDITGPLALVQFDRKFLFVPLVQGFVSSDDLASVNGFQYAEPYRCGFAMVSVNDARFYIDVNYQKAFCADFEFAESFHRDRALAKEQGRCRIIDTQGKTVADLDYDHVNMQSPWCWQMTMLEDDKFRIGFVDLNGNLIAELIDDYVGYYDPAVKRIPVVKNGRHGFLNEHAKVVIPVMYEYAEVLERGKAKVVLSGRTCSIDPNGVEVSE